MNNKTTELSECAIKHDGHLHSQVSHDGHNTAEEIYRRARELGLDGFAVTDHCDLKIWQGEETMRAVARSLDGAERARCEHLGFPIKLGIELGDLPYAPELAHDVIRAFDFDVVLGSVHLARYERWSDYYAKIDFSECEFSRDQLIGYLGAYLEDLERTAANFAIDVLTHLTCPLRYINGRYGRGIDLMEIHGERVEKILRIIIDRCIALEVNTSGFATDHRVFMPDRDIISLYRSLGGNMIYPGSDAHAVGNVGVGFAELETLLRDLGFDSYVFYDAREALRIKL